MHFSATSLHAAERYSWPACLVLFCERYYWFLLAVCLLLASVLRFWQLGSVPVAYFDEINIPQFGWALLNEKPNTPFVTAHPPLTHYLYALAMSAYYALPGVTGEVHQAWPHINPLSYRWLSAALGVACVFFAADWLRRLAGNALAAILLALFVALDASLVVDSRAALNNIVMLAFGLAAVWCWQVAADKHWHKGWLLAAGVLFGSVVSVKWNGLGFWLIPVAVLSLQALQWLLDRYRPVQSASRATWQGPDTFGVLLALVLMPMLTYWAWWQPYLWAEQKGFLEIHQIMRGFHTQQVGADDHPYCSAWFQWPWQVRPMSYLFEPVPAAGEKIYRVIHQLGNPALYPLGFLAALVSAAWLLRLFWRWFVTGVRGGRTDTLMFLLMGVAANFLPWMLVSRCLFSYHYQPASVFSFGALALVMTALWSQPTGHRSLNALGLLGAVLLLLLVSLAFVYWLPIAVGYPIPLDQFYRLMWFKSWI